MINELLIGKDFEGSGYRLFQGMRPVLVRGTEARIKAGSIPT
jgi:hypothetical protein